MVTNLRLATSSKVLINLIFVLISLGFIIPMCYIISVSFSNELDILDFGFRLIPRQISLLAYKYVFSNPKQILNAYVVSLTVVIIGSLMSVLFTAMLAYAISRKDYRYRNITSLYVFFTMLFNGGLVPWYILISKYLHLKDTLPVLILPYLISAWNVLIMKGFLESLPLEIIESCKIDGASEFRIFLQIVLPLSKPALATVGLFNALMYWNDWWLPMLFIENEKLIPLQYLLYRIMSNIQYLTKELSKTVNLSINLKDLPNESARMAMAVIAAGPMLVIFPFFQKYFTRGLTIGAIKG